MIPSFDLRPLGCGWFAFELAGTWCTFRADNDVERAEPRWGSLALALVEALA